MEPPWNVGKDTPTESETLGKATITGGATRAALEVQEETEEATKIGQNHLHSVCGRIVAVENGPLVPQYGLFNL